MALLRKFFNRKPPDGLLEICDRVFLFDSCFSSDSWEEEDYKVYITVLVNELQDHFPDAYYLMFNFGDVGTRSVIADVLSEYDLTTIMDYPRDYEGRSVLTVEAIHHFLHSTEAWLSLGPNNLLLMHCERGAWPVLAFMLAALLIYRKQYSGELKTLDMIYKQAPREFLQLFSPLNPVPSQLRYLQYVSRRNLVSEWPPLDKALTMDCVILRFVPDVSGQGGCRPIFRVYGQDPLFVDDKKPKLLYSTPKKGKHLRVYKQAECELVKIDINCHVQGDIVIECLSLNDDLVREFMLFRVVFNTAFISSNVLMLNLDEVDTLWHIKEQFPKGFNVKLLFSDMDAASSVDVMNFSCLEEKDGLPIEFFSNVEELFNQVDWTDQTDASCNMLQHLAIANSVQERAEGNSSPRLQGLSSKSIHDIVKQAAIENNAKLKLSSVSEAGTVDSPEKQPTGSAKKFIAQVTHSVLRISSQTNTTSQDAKKLLSQEPPSLNLVHHSATVKPFVDGSDFYQNAEENSLSSPPRENNGKVVSFSSSTPSPPRENNTAKKLKPYHWLKPTRAVTGSLWAETQMSSEASKIPEIDMTELESLFSASTPEPEGKSRLNSSRGPNPEKIQVIEHRRAYNCEIVLSKVKVPLQDLMYSVLNLEESALDPDQIADLIKFFPTREEMELLKGYSGDTDKLGKCELFFLEMMKVPRVKTKLRVFLFKIQFRSQISKLKNSLSVVNSTAEQIKNSEKFKLIMTILSLGNALNQWTDTGAAVEFKLDSLAKLSETRAPNNCITLMHYLCKILAEKMPEVLDFTKDLSSLEPATKIQLKFLAEEMQAINKGLEKVIQEVSLSENDGPISHNFNKILKEFLHYAEAEVRSLASLYSGVGRNVDGLILYFGEDPAKCHFEQVVSTLLNFVRLFNRAHEENRKQLEAEAKKKAEVEK